DFSIYEVPMNLMKAKLHTQILTRLGLEARQEPNVDDWLEMLDRVKNPRQTIEIAVAGKYIELHDAYKSIYESLEHAGNHFAARVELRKVSAEQVAGEGPDELLGGIDGMVVPGGFGERGFEGKIAAIHYARSRGIPFLGICYGMQAAVVEYARNVLGITDAITSEYGTDAANPVISLMEEQKAVSDLGGTMRLGAFDCRLQDGTRAQRAYGTTMISERHRHRYEFNNAYRSRLQEAGLVLSGINPKLDLVEIVEVPDHPWFVGVQFHPEFKTRPLKPHPLFRDFIAAAMKRGAQRT
ncbi:MAG: CTP synthase, partial [Planctomycetes bacterium]|nr:CTP synthase [Planctomycetota bacterium]